MIINLIFVLLLFETKFRFLGL